MARQIPHLERTAKLAALLLSGVAAGCPEDSLEGVPDSGSVEGYVCASEDELAVGATVAGEGVRETITAVTDQAGYFLLEKLAVGPQTLVVTGAPFTPTIDVVVEAHTKVRAPEPPCLETGTGVITGRICATEDGIGTGAGYWLAGARVVVVIGADRYETLTDADGNFTLPGVPEGTHTLEVSKGSFYAATEVLVVDGQTTSLDHVCVEPETQIGVVTGMFDAIEDVLARLGFSVRACLPAGMAGCPASLEPAGTVTLIDGTSTYFITDLLNDSLLLDEFDILFFNCGLADQWLSSAPESATHNLWSFVHDGGSIYASDRAYEILRVVFTGTVDFVGYEETWDSDLQRGWVGMLDNALPATILDSTLESVVGAANVTINYNKGQWVPLDPTQPSDVVVWLSANPAIDDDRDGTQDRTLTDAPILVSTPFGDGRIVFTTFHTHEQASADMEAILQYIVFEL